MKKLILLLATCLLLLDTCSFAQEIEWQNTIGGNVIDELHSVQQTFDGGYILGGVSASNISTDKSENCLGIQDYWIVKINSTGQIQWENTIGGSQWEFLYSIQQTTDGGFFLAGFSSSGISGDKTEINYSFSSTLYDFWVIKVNSIGNIEWQNTIGADDFEYLYSAKQTDDGGFILGGSSSSNISDDKTENSLGGHDYWVVKIDSIGNIQWQNTIGGSSAEALYSIQQTNDDGYILGGHSFSPISGDKTENNIGNWDYWVLKLDSIGNIQWQNTIGGNNEDQIAAIQQTSDGGYIIGGTSYSGISGDKTEINIGSADYWVVKLDSIGNLQWQNTIGGDTADYLSSIEQTLDGGYVLGGKSASGLSGDKTEYSLGGYDYWVLKLDSAGNIQHQNTIGGVNDDKLFSIRKTTDGGYIAGGISESNISGDKNEDHLGNWGDYWVMKLTEKYNTITGKIFLDQNSNQVQDTGEFSLSTHLIFELSSGRFAFSQQDGSYNLVVLDSGNFSVSPAQINYYNAVPAMHTAYFPGIQQNDSLNDFAIQPTGMFNDLCITITPLGGFVAGFNRSYMINYENVGTTTLSPTVIFFPDDDVTFVSANPVANSVTTDSVVWNFGPLAPFQTGSILVTVNVNVGTPIGTLINSGVRIEPVAGDANTACNYNYWEVYTVGSYDPNAILVDRDTVLTTELSNPPYLDYIIYFQNTGNDTAFNARVLNNIPMELDVTTFEFVASSHLMNITYGAHARLMTFTFDNINLPDSNVNEPTSHGFVRYRIKPNTTLVAGDSIRNTAFIYFDFNAPVQTNTAVTEIVLPTGLSQWSAVNDQLKIFPNPSSDVVNIHFQQLSAVSCQLSIYDLFGREVLQSTINNRQSTIKTDVSGLVNGVYVIQLNADEKVYRAKFVKQ